VTSMRELAVVKTIGVAPRVAGAIRLLTAA
jgi:hypothetical protein